MTVTTPGEKGFERKTPIGRVFTKAEILTGGKGGGWTRNPSLPLPSCARRVAAARATLSSAIKTPPVRGCSCSAKVGPEGNFKLEKFRPGRLGQSCRMLKNKRATSPSPHPSAIISGATGRSVLNFYPPHYFSPLFSSPLDFRAFS